MAPEQNHPNVISDNLSSYVDEFIIISRTGVTSAYKAHTPVTSHQTASRRHSNVFENVLIINIPDKHIFIELIMCMLSEDCGLILISVELQMRSSPQDVTSRINFWEQLS